MDDADDVALYDAGGHGHRHCPGITGLALDPELTRRYTAQFQTWLNAYYGTGINADGLWGPKTRSAAIRALQMELNHAYGAGLRPDGIWGPKTQAALVSVQPGDAGYLVRIIQGVLYARGYDPNGFDGVYGSGTKTAVWFFQRDKNLEATGTVDPRPGRHYWPGSAAAAPQTKEQARRIFPASLFLFSIQLRFSPLETVPEVLHLLPNLGDGAAKRIVPQAGGVLQSPVLPNAARQTGALDIAAHGHHHVHRGSSSSSLLRWLASMSTP